LLAIYLFAGATALRVIFGINMVSILTATTVLTAALAFAMQTSLANIVSGFHIQADRNFRSGTWVWLKDRDITGEVVNVGFRYSTILTTEGHRVHIPNHYLSQNVVATIGNREDGPTGINLKILLDSSFPPDRAKPLLLKALQDQPGIVREPAPSVRLDSFLDSGIQYNLRFHLEEYGTILHSRDGILERVWYAVRREGQTLPYPHREIVRKEQVPPFRVDSGAIREHLRRIGILSPLGDGDLDALLPHVRLSVYGRGETVVRQGEEGDSLFVVLAGSLEVEVDQRNVGSLSRGDFFGEMSLLTGEKRRATVRTIGEVRLLEISKAALEPVIRAHPSVAEGLTTSLERRLEKILTSQQVRVEAAEAPTLHEAILRRVRNFFGIS
jgi:CRP-like cAMP-binding protein